VGRCTRTADTIVDCRVGGLATQSDPHSNGGRISRTESGRSSNPSSTIAVVGQPMKPEELAELMQTLDDAWNAGPNSAAWETFRKRHTEDVAVYWPGQAEPTRGRLNHHAEAVEFFKTFPDNHLVNRPYKIFFAAGNHTCSVADFSGTMKGPMRMGSKTIPPTNRGFRVEFCTVASWNDRGEIIEERLFYDLVGLMKQIGLG
jgi:hypothetical protein